jgi:hypothetical protein
MILPGQLPPPDGGVIVMPVLLPRLREFVAENVPPPLNVIYVKAHQSHVQLLADEIVPTLPVKSPGMNAKGAEALALILVSVVTVSVPLTDTRLGADMVSVPIVTEPPMRKAVLVAAFTVTIL